MARHRRSRWATEAALQTLVRYGPQDSALRQAARDARSTYTSTVRTQRGAAEGIIGEVKRVTPGVRKGYDQAGLAAARTAHQVIDPVLAGLGSSAAPMVAATKIEQAGLQQRLKESRAADLGDLASRRVQAREGAAFATTNARNDLTAGLAKIFQRQQDLAGEKGAFAAATIGELQKAAADRSLRLTLNRRSTAQSERNSLRSSGIDPNTGKPIPGGRLDPKTRAKKNGSGYGPHGASLDKHLEWQTSIQEISNRAQQLRNAKDDRGRPLNLSREQIVQKLAAGRAQSRHLVATQGPNKGQVLPEGLTAADKKAAGAVWATLPSQKAYAPDLRMTAALDVALDGHLSPATQRKLHKAGFSVKQLNLPTYAEWKRTHRPYRGGGGHGGAPGANGQLRPT